MKRDTWKGKEEAQSRMLHGSLAIGSMKEWLSWIRSLLARQLRQIHFGWWRSALSWKHETVRGSLLCASRGKLLTKPLHDLFTYRCSKKNPQWFLNIPGIDELSKCKCKNSLVVQFRIKSYIFYLYLAYQARFHPTSCARDFVTLFLYTAWLKLIEKSDHIFIILLLDGYLAY